MSSDKNQVLLLLSPLQVEIIVYKSVLTLLMKERLTSYIYKASNFFFLKRVFKYCT